MSNQFQFELASPEKMVVSKAVTMVTVPSHKGTYGVLIGHAPMITTISAGVVEIFENDDAHVSDRVFVEDGFAEVTETRCTVLAGKATPVKNLDRKAIETDMQAIEDELAKAETDEDRDILENRRFVAQAKLQAIE